MKQMRVMAVALVAGLLAGSVEAGEEIAVELPGGTTMEFVWIEPGTFLMGSPFEAPEYRYASERPQHPVAITNGFTAEGGLSGQVRDHPGAMDGGHGPQS